jgi:predicted nucleic acid-binding protein
MYVGDFLPVLRARFRLSSDPTDAKLVELAIDGEATHLASFDRDLLSLPRARNDAGKRFRQRLPKLEIMMPEELLLQNPELEL